MRVRGRGERERTVGGEGEKDPLMSSTSLLPL